jgi:hypothetical protein
MYFVLLDSTGNLIASYRDEDEAREALNQIVDNDPSAANEVALMTYDDEGALSADPVFATSTIATVGDHADLGEWYGSRIVEAERGTETMADPVGT